MYISGWTLAVVILFAIACYICYYYGGRKGWEQADEFYEEVIVKAFVAYNKYLMKDINVPKEKIISKVDIGDAADWRKTIDLYGEGVFGHEDE